MHNQVMTVTMFQNNVRYSDDNLTMIVANCVKTAGVNLRSLLFPKTMNQVQLCLGSKTSITTCCQLHHSAAHCSMVRCCSPLLVVGTRLLFFLPFPVFHAHYQWGDTTLSAEWSRPASNSGGAIVLKSRVFFLRPWTDPAKQWFWLRNVLNWSARAHKHGLLSIPAVDITAVTNYKRRRWLQTSSRNLLFFAITP